MEFTIEEAKVYTADIAEAVRRLLPQLNNNYQPLTDHDIKSIIESGNTYLLLARIQESNMIVGMVTLVVYRIPYTFKGWIEDFVVDEGYRKHGIGSQLLIKSIAKARELGVKSLNLTSSPMREAANELYQRLGCVKRDTNVYKLNPME